MVDRVVATEEQWTALQEQYPAPAFELVRVTCQPGEIVLRNPNEVEYHAFSAETWGKPGTEGFPVAYRNAMLQQAVFPARNTLIAWLKRWPGLGHSAGVMKAIRYLSGQEESLAGKG